ncbi:MAG: putative DNA-binding domain-containing protein [Prosthecobacter sp.]|uniref:HvfC/BufC family peptide modification chaperone n=1 Tax=Prosthecobacter sp. TaxID=1965333 RepID=UPI0038FD6C5C
MPTPSQLRTNTDLRVLQRSMAAALMQPLTRSDGLQKSTQADFITPNDRMTGFQRLEIYARQYWFRLLDCLYDDYPALRVFLGERRFRQLCRDYLAAHSSVSWTLRNLGSQLPQFITESNARDVARIEWAQTLAFDEALKKPLHIDDLLGSDPVTLRLGVQPCVVLVQIDHAVDHFITAMKKSDAEVRGGASQAMSEAPSRETVRRRPTLKRERVHLVIHRHDNRLYFKRLAAEAFQLLAALRDGLTLAEAIDLALTNATPETDWPAQIRDWFAEWSQLGWFCKHSLKP